MLGANDIIKWCEDDGDGVRYASANIAIKGYSRCGGLKASKTCDATGNRFFSPGPSKDSPHGYLDCSIGPRIEIERHLDLEKEVIEFQDFRAGSDGLHIKNEIPPDKRRDINSPYAIFDQLLNNAKNAKSLSRSTSKKGRRRSRTKRASDELQGFPIPIGIPGGAFGDQLAPLLDGLGIDPGILNPPRNKDDMRKQEQAVRKLFDQLSPEEKEILEQMLGTSDIDALMKYRR